jgi:CheY-like chemotaxis protein
MAALEVMKWSSRVGRPFAFALIDRAAADREEGRFLRDLGAQPESAMVRVVLIDRGIGDGSDAAARERPGGPAILEWPVSQSALLQTISDILQAEKSTSKSTRALANTLSPEAVSTAGIWAGLRHILVAEDNRANQELILALLETRIPSHAVRFVDDGLEALKAATEEQFDLILMDIQMPRLSGDEAAAAIRRLDAKRGVHTPIIALTANAMKGDREAYISGGMDGYVSKPIDFETLFLEMERVMTLPIS